MMNPVLELVVYRQQERELEERLAHARARRERAGDHEAPVGRVAYRQLAGRWAALVQRSRLRTVSAGAWSPGAVCCAA